MAHMCPTYLWPIHVCVEMNRSRIVHTHARHTCSNHLHVVVELIKVLATIWVYSCLHVHVYICVCMHRFTCMIKVLATNCVYAFEFILVYSHMCLPVCDYMYEKGTRNHWHACLCLHMYMFTCVFENIEVHA